MKVPDIEASKCPKEEKKATYETQKYCRVSKVSIQSKASLQ